MTANTYDLDERRCRAVRDAFEHFDFRDYEVEATSGVERTLPGNEYKQLVFLRIDPDQDTFTTTFTVNFEPDSSRIAEAYALNSSGSFIGRLPNAPRDQLMRDLGWIRRDFAEALELMSRARPVEVSDDEFQDLLDQIRDHLGAKSANQETDAEGQEQALDKTDQWVSDHLSNHASFYEVHAVWHGPAATLAAYSAPAPASAPQG